MCHMFGIGCLRALELALLDCFFSTSRAEEFESLAARPFSSTSFREVSLADVSLGPLLGEGAFSAVHRASWNGIPVAVKLLTLTTPRSRESDARALLREAAAIQVLGVHPHVVRLVGVCTRGDSLALVTELCSKGSLEGYVRRGRGDRRVDAEEKLWLLRDAAEALAFVHAEGYVHGDVAARNVLVNGRRRAVLADFGLARMEGELAGEDRQSAVPVKWMAPEALSGAAARPSDVYAFGTLMWEVMGERRPWDGVDVTEVRRRVLAGERPEMREVGDLERLIGSCWEHNPDKRPTMKDVVVELNKCIFALPPAANAEGEGGSRLIEYQSSHERDEECADYVSRLKLSP